MDTISINSVKEGVAKSRLKHDSKTLFDDNTISKLHIAFIRQIGGRVYTHSQLPFPHKLYQKKRKELIAYNQDYKVYYNCIRDVENKKIYIKNNSVFSENGFKIA